MEVEPLTRPGVAARYNWGVLSRRDFLNAAAFTLAAGHPGAKLRGIFPVLSAPVDVENISGADGIVWPLPDNAERAISAARRRGLAVILRVQGPDLDSSRRHARRAEKLAPDAIMAAPLADLEQLARHYRAIAGECGLPLVAHAAGAMSLEFVLRIRKEIPTLRMVKDETG